MMPDSSLAVSGLSLIASHRGAERRLVDSVGFAVRRGRVTALVGASGSGKTLSCMAMLGLLPPGVRQSAGDILIDGRPLDAAAMRVARGRTIGLIQQNPRTCFNPLLRIGRHFRDSYAAIGIVSAEADRRAETMLTQVGLPEPAQTLERFPHELSGGMLQRAMIALALVPNPAFLIADEPTSDLDLVNQRQVLDLLLELRDRHGLGTILVTHDLSVAAYMADDIVVFDAGRAVEAAALPAFLRAPASPAGQDLLNAYRTLADGSERCADSNAPGPSETLLAADGLVKTYDQGGAFLRRRRITVLEWATIQIAPRSRVGLIGPSGSGKSTLGRLLLGLERADSGRVIFNDGEIDRAPSLGANFPRHAVQAVFQDPLGSVNPRLSAFDVVAEPLRNFERLDGPALRSRVAELLEMVGVPAGESDRLATRFSGGQLQRICIARALAARPRLIVLDEAVSNLDMHIQSRILHLLKTLQRRDDIAYLFITHDIRLVRSFCDRVLVLESGRLVEIDRPGASGVEPATLRILEGAVLPAPSPA